MQQHVSFLNNKANILYETMWVDKPLYIIKTVLKYHVILFEAEKDTAFLIAQTLHKRNKHVKIQLGAREENMIGEVLNSFEEE